MDVKSVVDPLIKNQKWEALYALYHDVYAVREYVDADQELLTELYRGYYHSIFNQLNEINGVLPHASKELLTVEVSRVTSVQQATEFMSEYAQYLLSRRGKIDPYHYQITFRLLNYRPKSHSIYQMKYLRKKENLLTVIMMVDDHDIDHIYTTRQRLIRFLIHNDDIDQLSLSFSTDELLQLFRLYVLDDPTTAGIRNILKYLNTLPGHSSIYHEVFADVQSDKLKETILEVYQQMIGRKVDFKYDELFTPPDMYQPDADAYDDATQYREYY